MSSYLVSVRQQFEYYKMLGEKTIQRLTLEQLMWSQNEDSNSVAIIVKHLHGNMLSRWTDFLTTDGEKEWRHRDREFVGDINGQQDLMALWEEGWQCLFDALDTLTDQDLERTVFIRNQAHTVMEAINRQLAHYPYHIGQIVYIGKLLCGDSWESLSIPKGKSDEFNKKLSR